MKLDLATIEARRADAERRVAQLANESGFKRWLSVRAAVHSFSWTNQVLLAQQAHERGIELTTVMAAWRWKREGYHPEKGSSAMLVWTFRSRRRKGGAWICCGRPVPGGTHRCATCGREDHYFRLGPVFDASQVVAFSDGTRPPRPPAVAHVDGDEPGTALLERFTRRLADAEIADTVILGAQPDHGERGSWNTATRVLTICEGSPNGMLAVAIHEAAHAQGITSHSLDLSYDECEVAAECVAYVVAAAAGLDTSAQAIPYMLGWAGAEHQAKMCALAALIDEHARRLERLLLDPDEPDDPGTDAIHEEAIAA